MNTAELLRIAWEAVEASGLPPELRETAFRAAFDHEASIASAQARSAGPRHPEPSEQILAINSSLDRSKSLPEGVSSVLRRLSDETELSVDDLSEVLVFEEDGSVAILPRGPKLGKGPTAKARTVASLITGARFGAMGERTTSIEVVRKACEDRGCYDQANFKSFHIGRHPALGVRDNLVHIVPSKWLPDFQAAIARARGLESDLK